MTIVISDTSPINDLVLIGEIGLLPSLYQRVLIPDAVLSELLDEGSPAAVAAWASMLPDWAEVVLTAVDASGSSLDAGEFAAIALAESLKGETLLLMDDAEGRAEATRRGLPITGTLGVLRAAAHRQLVDIASAVDRLDPARPRLDRTNFYIPPRLVGFLLTENRDRRRR